jgi:uncharacterized membrane protein YgdD (TMEM256/DUF423 family)
MQGLFTLGCLSGFIAVGAGAAGAHALQGHFVERGAAWWALAVDYHAVHALALLFAAWAVDRWPRSLGARAAGSCFFIGILFFCGGLYLRALGSDLPLIHLVPVGGSIWLVGWLSLAIAPWR